MKEQGEYQLCPKCNGQGQVSRPPYLAGDIYTWSSDKTVYTCNVCNGSGVLARPFIECGGKKVFIDNKTERKADA